MEHKENEPSTEDTTVGETGQVENGLPLDTDEAPERDIGNQ